MYFDKSLKTQDDVVLKGGLTLEVNNKGSVTEPSCTL